MNSSRFQMNGSVILLRGEGYVRENGEIIMSMGPSGGEEFIGGCVPV